MARSWTCGQLPRPVFCVLLLASTSALAQCANVWQQASPVPGTNGPVLASVMWDPDGAGPASPNLVVGGEFTTAGGVPAQNIARFDPATGTWVGLGGGVSGAYLGGSGVQSLAVLPNGDLVVGGSFTSAGGVAAGGIARWNGAGWSSLGGSTNGAVYTLLVLANGDLVAGGVFSLAGTVAAQRIARWNGAAWSPFGFGLDHYVLALAQMPNGDLIAGGYFWQGVKRWNGTSWITVGAGQYNGTFALTVTSSGDLVAGGYDGVRRWNGMSWIPLGSLQHVEALQLLPNGDLIAAGTFNIWIGGPAQCIARWNGLSWSPLAEGIYNIYAYAGVATLTLLPTGELVAGGWFDHAGAGGADNVALWDGSAWWPFGRVLNGDVNALVTLPAGDHVVGGAFTTAGGFVVNGVARWNGSAWFPVGSGMNGPVFALLQLHNGDLVAGGAFTTAGGAAANNIARWDGATWSALGPGVNAAVHALAQRPNGDLVVGGRFTAAGSLAAGYVAQWDGVSWYGLGAGISPTYNGAVHALLLLGNGDLIAGGRFATAGGVPASHIARWNGSSWTPLGSGMSQAADGVLALASRPNGDLLAAGRFTTAGGVAANSIALWDGQAWAALGPGPSTGLYLEIAALATLPGGDIVAGGRWNQGLGNLRYLARWNGSAWIDLATGPGPAVAAFAHRPNDDLVVGQSFSSWGSGGGGASFLATMTTTCPPVSAPFGAGCVGAAGLNLLAATTQPWLGTTFRSRASGLAANSLAVAIYSFNQVSIPMPAVHPQGVAGCELLVPDEILLQFALLGGSVDSAIAIPSQPMLVGATFYHQVVPVELDPTSNIVALTSTNGLALTVGAF